MKKRPITCLYCKYSWKTRSKSKLISCPHCALKTTNPDYNTPDRPLEAQG